MASIEERVVGMRFDNSKFQSGITPVLDGLDKLKAGLKMEGATKGLEELDSAGKRFTLAGLMNATEGVSAKFLAMATVGITALSNIVNKAVNAGQRILESLTIDPIKAGLDEYELKMGSIQTILANTARYGTNLKQVTDSLDELNTYADKTIYNFGDMTKNIGLFTNAGLRIEEATSLIKGFSNESAASGVTAAGAAGAAYQLSQALSAGQIRLMDWRSLTNVGLGNKNMQRGILEIAEAMGTLEGKSITGAQIQKDFNGSLEKGWLTADVMSKYLQIMAGDLDVAAQKSLGLSDKQIAAFAKQQKTAEDAATKVRTYTQLIGTMQESVGSGWAQSFDIIIGDFEEATDLFTAANNSLGGLIGAASDARNKILQDWSDNGGRAAAIEAIATAFKSVMAILRPVKEAFEEVFPPATGKQVADITKNIRDFIAGLVPGKKILEDIKSTAKGFFAAIDLGVMVLVGFVKMVAELLGVASKGTGGLLEFTGSIGDMIVRFRDAVKEGNGVTRFFEILGGVLKGVLAVVGFVAGVFLDLFTSASSVAESGFGEWLEKVRKRLDPISGLLDLIQNGMERLKGLGEVIARVFAPLANVLGNLFRGIGEAMKESFQANSFSPILDAINTGLLGGIGVLIYKFITNLKGTLGKLDPGQGLMATIKGVFGELGNTMQALQGQIKAKTLLTIAGAVGLLTLSVVALSLIDTAKLFIALGAITIMFTQLGAAMYAFEQLFTIADAAKLTVLSAAMIGMASAMVVFAGAVAIMGSMSAEELAIGLIGLAGAMAIVSGAMLLLSKTGPGAILGSAALVIASAGMLILAGALKVLATLSWDDIGRGMVALGGALLILAVGLTLMAASLPGAAALTIASVGILIMAAALKVFATLSWDDIGRAMVVLGGSLLILALGLTLMVAALPGAAALVVASVGLAVIAGVLKVFGTMNWDDIGRAMTILGGTLGILALGLTLMVAALPGAAALVVAAGALAILAPVLVILGSLSWEQIGTGLGALALTLGVLAAAAYLMTPVIPSLLALGGAIVLLGAGLALAGVGVLALATGLSILAVAGGGAIGVLIAAVSGIAGLIPFILQQVGLGIIEIIKIIGENGPAILGALTTVLLALVGAIVAIIPPVIDAIILLVTKLVEALVVLIPLLVDGGMRLIIGILDGIAKNIGKVIQKGTDVIVALLDGIGKAIPRLLQAGANLIIDFINGLADTIRKNTARIQKAGANLADAIIDGMTGGIRKGITTVVNAVKNMANDALNAAKKALGIKSPSREFKAVGKFSTQGLADGLTQFSSISEKAASDLGDNTLKSLKKSMADAGNSMSLSMDSAPTIRPVLDLSALKKDAGLIGGIVGGQTLAVDGATARANEIAAKYGEVQQAKADALGSRTEVNMTQINNSPKVIPAPELYRQTKSEMSKLKGELEKRNA